MSQPNLTPREREAVGLLVDYYSQKHIASKWGVSPVTVHQQVMSARNKFGAVSTGEMLRRARLMGITS